MHQHSLRRNLANTAVAAGVLAMALTGCGDDDNDTPDVPGLIDEDDIETFEPTDDESFDMPTVEPEEGS